MSKTVIVTVDAIETITKTAEVVVRVPDGISHQEFQDLVVGFDLGNRLGLDWRSTCRDAAKVTEEVEEIGKPDVVSKRIGEEFVAGVNE